MRNTFCKFLSTLMAEDKSLNLIKEINSILSSFVICFKYSSITLTIHIVAWSETNSDELLKSELWYVKCVWIFEIISLRSWQYGTFDWKLLDHCLHLLEENRMGYFRFLLIWQKQTNDLKCQSQWIYILEKFLNSWTFLEKGNFTLYDWFLRLSWVFSFQLPMNNTSLKVNIWNKTICIIWQEWKGLKEKWVSFQITLTLTN